MAGSELNVVTGASGFTGRYIARRLLSVKQRVLNLTGHPERRAETGDQIPSVPFNFDKPDELADSLRGATTLCNTYWIRFPYGALTFDDAVRNSITLIKAAKDAGIRRFVHISVTNPSLDSPLPYFRGKAVVEQAIIESGLSFAVLRPAVIFGDEGILINNIAWLLRRFPVFAIPGDGSYQLQPIFVEDLAELAVNTASGDDDIIMDAVGPETYSFNSLLRLVARTVRSRTRLMHLNPPLTFLLSKLLGHILGDRMLTRDEVKGLMANLLVSEQPPTGDTRLSDWLAESADWIGTGYMSELKKHYR
ncbi:MAG TPA: NAD(P)H-binding protein [Armatimonadota bacterium]|nr:NAD(P)H-binding protein [Armatimonadota bacterium]